MENTKGPFTGSIAGEEEEDQVLAEVSRRFLLADDLPESFLGEMIDVNELKDLTEPDWIIDGWIMRGGLTILFADTGTGKTIISLGMGKGVARGKRWQQANCVHGGVMYFQGENLVQLRQRNIAWDKEYPPTGNEKPFKLSRQADQHHDARRHHGRHQDSSGIPRAIWHTSRADNHRTSRRVQTRRRQSDHEFGGERSTHPWRNVGMWCSS